GGRRMDAHRGHCHEHHRNHAAGTEMPASPHGLHLDASSPETPERNACLSGRVDFAWKPTAKYPYGATAPRLSGSVKQKSLQMRNWPTGKTSDFLHIDARFVRVNKVERRKISFFLLRE